MRFLRNFQLEVISFWLGFIAASLFWWLIRRFSSQLKSAFIKFKELIQGAGEILKADTEVRYRTDVFKYAQGLHVASELFSLDEIIIEPRILTLPTNIIPGQIPPHLDVASETIPYTPDWPELAAHYKYNSFSLVDLLPTGTNVAIISPAGHGKTTALAYLTSILAKSDFEDQDIARKVPFFLYAPDYFEEAGNSPIEKLTNAISSYISALTHARFRDFVQATFRQGRAVLLVDGVDELPPPVVDEMIKNLQLLKSQFPNVQMVLAVDTQYFGDLSEIEAQPVALRGWGFYEHRDFLDQWGKLWQRWITGPQQLDPQNLEPLLLNHWLLMDAHTYSPLEFTLKVWGSYANDLIGSHPLDIMSNYIARMTGSDIDLQVALEQAAYNSVLAGSPLVNAETGPELFSIKAEYEEPINANSDQTDENSEENDLSKTDVDTDTDIEIRKVGESRLRSARMLITRAKNTYGFRNPSILAYLASQHIKTNTPTSLIQKPEWALKRLTTNYLSFYQDTSQFIISEDQENADPLQTDLVVLARSIRYIPDQSKRLSTILESIVFAIQQVHIPLGVKVRLFTAILTLNNRNIESILRYLRGSSNPEIRQLAALGTGVLRNSTAVPALIYLLDDVPVIAKSACLALVQIGTEDALEAVIRVLLESSEDMRRAAAEALANHEDEGYPVLIDGTQVDDLLVRRAVVFGLRRTREEWAIDKLREVQIEESEWVVRDAAEQALSAIKEPDPGLPEPPEDLVNLPWLIAFASEYGQGISTQDSAREMLLTAFRMGTPVQKIAALEHLWRRADQEIFPEIFDFLFGSDFELSETAANVIWHLQRYGIEIPTSKRSGFA